MLDNLMTATVTMRNGRVWRGAERLLPICMWDYWTPIARSDGVTHRMKISNISYSVYSSRAVRECCQHGQSKSSFPPPSSRNFAYIHSSNNLLVCGPVAVERPSVLVKCSLQWYEINTAFRDGSEDVHAYFGMLRNTCVPSSYSVDQWKMHEPIAFTTMIPRLMSKRTNAKSDVSDFSSVSNG
jgi:hypothetical protein